MWKDTQQSSERRRHRRADGVSGAFARAFRAERARPVAALREEVLHLGGHVAEARHAVVDDVRIHQLPPFVDELLVQRGAETHRRRSGILAVNERGVDREADVAHGRELLDVDNSGLAIDGEP